MNILVCAYKSEMQHKNAAYFLHHYHLTDKSDKKPFYDTHGISYIISCKCTMKQSPLEESHGPYCSPEP